MRVEITARGCRRFLPVVAALSLMLSIPAVPAAGQRQCLCPVDEAPKIESLERFHRQLRTAVHARDLAAFARLVASDVAIAGDERGFATLIEVYELDDPWSVVLGRPRDRPVDGRRPRAG